MRKLPLILFSFFLGFLHAQNTWQKLADFGGGNRDIASGFAIGNTGYILSGTDTGGYFTDMWAWNQNSNTWTEEAVYPGGKRIGTRSVSLNGFGYVLGGEKPSNCFAKFGGGVCAGTFFADIWKYDPDSNLWSVEDTSFPGAARNYAVAVADPANSTIYYGTGNNNGVTFLSDWWAFHTLTHKWVQLKNFAGGQRDYAVGFLLNNCIYVGSGDNGDFINNASNDFWEYSISSGKWRKVADIPGVPIRCASAFTVGNYGYVCLGISDTTYTNACWRYDPATNSWLQIATYPGDLMSDGVAFTIGGYGYIGTGGYDGNDYSDFWAYNPDDLLGLPHPVIVNPYPNPAKNTVNFKYSNVPTLPAQLTVIDILGKEVSSTTVTNSSGQIAVDITGYNAGVYFYELTAGGKSLMAGKILIGR